MNMSLYVKFLISKLKAGNEQKSKIEFGLLFCPLPHKLIVNKWAIKLFLNRASFCSSLAYITSMHYSQTCTVPIIYIFIDYLLIYDGQLIDRVD